MNRSEYAFPHSFDSPDTLPRETSRYGFKINELGFIYNSNISSEVIKAANVCTIPATKQWFNGVINIRGNLVPVFDLNLLFFNEKTENQLFLILGKDKKSVALRIKQFPQLIEEIEETQGDNILFKSLTIPALIQNYISHYYINESHAWLEVDTEAFFASITQQISLHS
ncbi:MAG: chemotaxis protein CheW [Methylococcaceae bacterium]|nr:chemotaxis protein CheW [Methylococcaceae bacterium]